MKNKFDSLWVEKYRPQKLDDLIVSKKCRDMINKIIQDNEIPHLLLTGSPGIGKTSLAKVIVNDVLQSQYIYLNMSDKGIDAVRDDIVNFAQTKSFDGGIKIVICDEFDGCSTPAQKALRNTMEEYAKNTRFILTANNKNNIIPAIQSRCVSLDLQFDKKDVLTKCINILETENITVQKETVSEIVDIIKSNYPDLRQTISRLQMRFSNDIEIIHDSSIDIICGNVYNYILEDIENLRKYIIENEHSFNGDYNNLLTKFLNYIYDIKKIDFDKKMSIIITIRDYLWQSSFITDLEINTISCLFTIHKILKKIK